MRFLRHIIPLIWLSAALIMAGCAAATTGNLIPVAEDVPEDVIEILPSPTAAATTLPTPPAAAPDAVVQETAVELTPAGMVQETAVESTLVPTSAPDATAQPSPTPENPATPRPEPTYAVEDVEHVDGFVYAKTVNLRAKPTTDSEILGEFERYDELVVTGKFKDWYRVRIDGMRGYMLKEFVEIGDVPDDDDEPEPTAAQVCSDDPGDAAAAAATGGGAGGFSEADILLAAQLVSEESGRTADGYRAVANVIYNRVMSGKFPDSVEGVVFQGNGAQFSPAEDEGELRSVTPSSEVLQAVREVFSGSTILDADVLYFRSASKGTSWGSTRVYAGTYGGNAFFK